MKKAIYTLIILFAVAALVVVSGCSDQKTDEKAKADSSQVYTCPMHPEVVSDEPGLCPKCNMHLVPKEAAHDHSEMESSSRMENNSEMEDHAKMVSAPESDSKVQQYTCGMHPQIITDEPGTCPICNMNLVPKVDRGKGDGAVLIDPTTRQNMAVATTKVEYMKISKTVRAFGNVTYSEPELFSINVKIKGYVEKLFVNETGIKVNAGQPLFEIYSPELVAAQQEYLIAFNTFGSDSEERSAVRSRMINAAYNRLKNWDITDRQIRELEKSGQVTRTMTIRSPYTGTVTDKYVKEGDYISSGKDLFEIADLSSVWVSAFVYEQDLPYISYGQEVAITSPSLLGEEISSKIIYISPFLNSNRQAEVRVEIDNAKSLLKPSMFAEVRISMITPEHSIVIPRSAVINSGMRQLVFIESAPGEFRARGIKTGMVADGDLVEVLEGLETGEMVVVSGQFMLDSETRLNEAIASSSGGGNAHQQH
ncbi:MAG: efflux RND transporter periplasmic adaptor subunit [candidate division Zixibacteria bacterium]